MRDIRWECMHEQTGKDSAGPEGYSYEGGQIVGQAQAWFRTFAVWPSASAQESPSSPLPAFAPAAHKHMQLAGA